MNEMYLKGWWFSLKKNMGIQFLLNPMIESKLLVIIGIFHDIKGRSLEISTMEQIIVAILAVLVIT